MIPNSCSSYQHLWSLQNPSLTEEPIQWVRPDIPTPPYDALLPRASSQCWAYVPQEREVSMRVYGYVGPLSTEAKASPCVSQGLRSTQSLDPICLCCHPSHEHESRRTSSPASLGAAPADLVGQEGKKKILEEGWLQGDTKPLLSMFPNQLSRR